MTNLKDLISSDVARYNKLHSGFFRAIASAAYTHPAFLGLVFYRISRYSYLRSGIVGRLMYFFTKALFPFVRVISGVDVSPRCSIGRAAFFGHSGPIVIHPEASIGDQVTLMQGVTIGHAGTGVPVVGSFVSMGVNSVLVGGIKVGNYSVVGAGAVVVRDVHPCSVMGGVPAKKMVHRAFPGKAALIFRKK